MAGKGKVHSQANGEKAELAHLKPALQELLSAWECAHDVQSDPWQFAVETADLTALGLGKSGLRWLVRKGFAEHARELTRRGDAARGFQPEPSLAFTSKSCFILTAAGHSWLERAGAAPAVLRLYETPAGALAVAALSPRWDLRDADALPWRPGREALPGARREPGGRALGVRGGRVGADHRRPAVAHRRGLPRRAVAGHGPPPERRPDKSTPALLRRRQRRARALGNTPAPGRCPADIAARLRTGRCKTVVFSNDKWHSQGGHPALP